MQVDYIIVVRNCSIYARSHCVCTYYVVADGKQLQGQTTCVKIIALNCPVNYHITSKIIVIS